MICVLYFCSRLLKARGYAHSSYHHHRGRICRCCLGLLSDSLLKSSQTGLPPSVSAIRTFPVMWWSMPREGFLQSLSECARLEQTSASTCGVILDAAKAAGWAERICLNRVGSMFTLFFCRGPVNDFSQARGADATLYARFFRAMLARGVYLPPSQFEAAFVSSVMDRKVLKKVSVAARSAFDQLSRPG